MVPTAVQVLVPDDCMVVSKALIEETIAALEKVYAKQITMNNGTHERWLRKRIDALRAAQEGAS